MELLHPRFYPAHPGELLQDGLSHRAGEGLDKLESASNVDPLCLLHYLTIIDRRLQIILAAEPALQLQIEGEEPASLPLLGAEAVMSEELQAANDDSLPRWFHHFLIEYIEEGRGGQASGSPIPMATLRISFLGKALSLVVADKEQSPRPN